LATGCRRDCQIHKKCYRLSELNITPHIVHRTGGKSVDGRTTRHEGYAVSQRKRKRVEAIFGWAKTVGLIWYAPARSVRTATVSRRVFMGHRSWRSAFSPSVQLYDAGGAFKLRPAA
jgi:hypothetical protein